jgi:class 3 adenylate cyclase
VTVLFCDLAGYTHAGDRLDPEALRRLQSGYFESARAALERHGGRVEKFIGDAVMAVFGVPVVHEDDALRALRAAVELREAVVGLGLQARIGVNTGEVVAGTGDALVTGDAVNVAARLQQAAAPGEILFGEWTRRLARDAVVAAPVEPLTVKGKAQRVAASRLLSLAGGAPAFERRLESPLVGRERELGLLRQAFDRAVSERACHLFTVLGAAGVGKSRLVLELSGEIADRATVLTGRCLPYGEGITYGPLAEVFGVTGSEDELAAALALSSTEETFWAVRKWLERRAHERPVVLLLDDLHWGEPTFLCSSSAWPGPSCSTFARAGAAAS